MNAIQKIVTKKINLKMTIVVFLKKEKEKEIKWYNLIECKLVKSKEYKRSNHKIVLANIPSIYLPAGYLKNKKILPHLDLGDKEQFCFDFSKLKVKEKSIDDNHDFINDKGQIAYNKILPYVRHLYRAQSGIQNDYGVEIDQVKRQFIFEFCKFSKTVLENDIYNIENLKISTLAEVLKLFILYRSVKITNITNPLNAERDFLPEEARVNGIDDIFIGCNDALSVAPLDGKMHSLNEVFIEKMYALLWINANISEAEITLLCDYIILLEEIVIELSNRFWDIASKIVYCELVKLRDAKLKEISSEWINKKVVEYFQFVKSEHIKRLDQYFLNYGMSVSLFSYFIANIYINNKLKLFFRNKISNQITKLLDIEYPKVQELKKIKDIVKSVEVEKKEDFINLFNENKTCISKEDQQRILTIIFPDNKKSKTAKRRILENNFEQIMYIYIQFIFSRLQAGEKIEFLTCYNLIIASYLYFKLKDVAIPRGKAKTFTNSMINNERHFDDRCSKIGSLFKQIKKADWEAFYYYSELSGSIETKYHTLFYAKPAVNKVFYNQLREVINDGLIAVLQAGLKEIYKFTKI